MASAARPRSPPGDRRAARHRALALVHHTPSARPPARNVCRGRRAECLCCTADSHLGTGISDACFKKVVADKLTAGVAACAAGAGGENTAASKVTGACKVRAAAVAACAPAAGRRASRGAAVADGRREGRSNRVQSPVVGRVGARRSPSCSGSRATPPSRRLLPLRTSPRLGTRWRRRTWSWAAATPLPPLPSHAPGRKRSW